MPRNISRSPTTAGYNLLFWVLLALAACNQSGETTAPSPTAIQAAPTVCARTPTNPVPGDTRVRHADGMIMVYVPAGTFEMGATDAQIDAIMRDCVALEGDDPRFCRREHYRTAQPVHSVTLDAFWIDQTEVTNAQFAKFLNEMGNRREDGVEWLEMGKYGHIEKTGGEFRPRVGFERHPVIEVSWYGAAAYCAWAGGRLPTEAEWEYAARGPDGSIYPWGSRFDGTLVNYRDRSFTFQDFGADPAYDDGHSLWAPIGSYPAGASWCGAYDLAGNVWEWVNDRWGSDYYAGGQSDNPRGPETGDLRIVRGGSWFDPGYRVRCDIRKGLRPSSRRMHWVGFRCVVEGGR